MITVIIVLEERRTRRGGKLLAFLHLRVFRSREKDSHQHRQAELISSLSLPLIAQQEVMTRRLSGFGLSGFLLLRPPKVSSSRIAYGKWKAKRTRNLEDIFPPSSVNYCTSFQSELAVDCVWNPEICYFKKLLHRNQIFDQWAPLEFYFPSSQLARFVFHVSPEKCEWT